MQKYSTTEELMHYGIKGMKWGVRRYQNKDGTLTSAGRKRKSLGQTIQERRDRKKDADYQKRLSRKDEILTSKSARKVYKNRDLLSDEELRDRINRINMEQQLGRLADNEVGVGKKTTTKILSRAGNAVLNVAVQETVNAGFGVAREHFLYPNYKRKR